MAKVTIIIPNYNHADYIVQRLESIRQQTYTHWEAIIIDDASTDHSVDIISEYLQKHNFPVKAFIKHEKNSGSGYLSWQKGIALSDSEYIWIAETDDYCDRNFLEVMVDNLDKNQNASLCFSGTTYVNEKGKTLYNSSKRTQSLNVPNNTSKVFEGYMLISKLPLNTYITNASSVLFRTPAKEVPDFIFSHKQSSDIFFWTYLVNGNHFIHHNAYLNYFRQHQKSTTALNTKLRMQSVYIEKIEYLKYFGQTEKYKALIDHYIKYYVWKNKKRVFDLNLLKHFDNSHKVRNYYFKSLFQYTVKRITNYGKK